MRRLIYFNHCLVRPGGSTDPFYLVERDWLQKHFDRVDVVAENGWARLEDTMQEGFYLHDAQFSRIRAILMALFQPEVWRELLRMYRDGQMNLTNLKRFWFFVVRGIRMYLHVKPLLNRRDQITLYSFWMSFDGYAAALCHRLFPQMRLVMRGHAFDVDVERTPLNPYLMKQMMTEHADGVYPISEAAREQLMSYMQGRLNPDKVHVLAVGSAGDPVDIPKDAPMYNRGILRVVSCAMVLPIKQVDVLVEALSRWEGCPLYWTHIGGGEGLEKLRSLVDEKLGPKENVIGEILGMVDNEHIHELYQTRAFDVFINTSRKEGVPVSIMEAMRYGTPVIAPRVGGIPELVTPDVGWLYESQDGAQGVLEALEKLVSLSQEEAEAMRENACRRWKEHFWSSALLPGLFPGTTER